MRTANENIPPNGVRAAKSSNKAKSNEKRASIIVIFDVCEDDQVIDYQDFRGNPFL